MSIRAQPSIPKALVMIVRRSAKRSSIQSTRAAGSLFCETLIGVPGSAGLSSATVVLPSPGRR